MRKQSQTLIQFLANSGALASGDPAKIAAAKAEYRRLYKRAYMRRYRTAHRDVQFTIESSIGKLLDRAASMEGVKGTVLAKQILVQWLQGGKHMEGVSLRKELIQEIALIGSHVRQLCRHQPKGFFERRVRYDELVKRIDALEEKLRLILLKYNVAQINEPA